MGHWVLARTYAERAALEYTVAFWDDHQSVSDETTPIQDSDQPTTSPGLRLTLLVVLVIVGWTAMIAALFITGLAKLTSPTTAVRGCGRRC